jgi:hypothetical protein
MVILWLRLTSVHGAASIASAAAATAFSLLVFTKQPSRGGFSPRKGALPWPSRAEKKWKCSKGLAYVVSALTKKA